MLASIAGDLDAERTFAQASRVLGYDVRERDDAAALASTVNVQLGLLVAGVASGRMLERRGVQADAVAGHSVGGFAAAVYAESIAFDDALRAVRERASVMEKLFPRGYGMGVIAGLREQVVAEIVRSIARPQAQIFIANVNAPTQLVIAGENDALARALEAGRSAGARRAERLDVAVPSHCPLLAPVQAHLETVLAPMEIRNPRTIYVGSVGPRLVRDAQALRHDLAAGVAHAVRWYDATTMMIELGTSEFIEAVPGHVLTDLAQAAFPRARAIALEDAGARSAAALARRA